MYRSSGEEDSTYWEQFRKGDRQAFSAIYFAHYNSLYYYGLKICANTDTVKDTIHELFFRLWNNHENTNEVKSVKFYLLKALKRDLVHRMDRDRKRITLHESFAEIDIEFSPEDIFVQTEADDAQKKLFVDLLNTLPRRQKEALYLKYYEDLSNDEIAEMMSMNYQSVANLLQRGLKTLRDHLNLWFLASFLHNYYA
jgi:RNA polymerase sigma factor (sigma-70 family)